MVYSFHSDKEKYFDYQYQNSRDYIVPFVREFLYPYESKTILEIGCAEGGVMKAFLEEGCVCTGIELSQSRIEYGKIFLQKELKNGQVKFISKDIHEIDLKDDIQHKNDLIILKDVIEHIYDQEKIIKKLGEFIKKDGKIFFGFPPWYMPFGGHQQMCKNKFLSLFPFYHLLPRKIYKNILKIFGETEIKINNLLAIKDTGISIERFERIVKNLGYKIYKRKYYLVNPIYHFKFGVKPREMNAVFSKIPILRNFYTSAMYYLIGK